MLLRSPLSTQDATCTWAFVRFEASRTSRVWNRLLLSIRGGDSTRAFRRCTRVYVRRKPVQNHRRVNICWPATLICAEPSNDVSKKAVRTSARRHFRGNGKSRTPSKSQSRNSKNPMFWSQDLLRTSASGSTLARIPPTSHHRIQQKISSRHPFLQDPPPF